MLREIEAEICSICMLYGVFEVRRRGTTTNHIRWASGYLSISNRCKLSNRALKLAGISSARNRVRPIAVLDGLIKQSPCGACFGLSNDRPITALVEFGALCVGAEAREARGAAHTWVCRWNRCRRLCNRLRSRLPRRCNRLHGRLNRSGRCRCILWAFCGL